MELVEASFCCFVEGISLALRYSMEMNLVDTVTCHYHCRL